MLSIVIITLLIITTTVCPVNAIQRCGTVAPPYLDRIVDQVRIQKLCTNERYRNILLLDNVINPQSVISNTRHPLYERNKKLVKAARHQEISKQQHQQEKAKDQRQLSEVDEVPAIDQVDLTYSLSCSQLCDQCIVIDTYFHIFTLPFDDDGGSSGVNFVIPHPTSAVNNTKSVKGSFTSLQELNEMIAEQMAILNASYATTPFAFRHMNPNNPSISTNYQYTMYAYDYFREMSKKHSVGGLETLNIFLSYSVTSRNVSTTSTTTSDTIQGDLVAFASFPSHQLYKETLGGDGVFMRYDCLVNGGFTGTDRGFTLVHEVGHWLGLYHTFQRSINKDPQNFGKYPECSPADENDYVSDTPESAASAQDLYHDCTKYLPETTTDNSTVTTKFKTPDSCPNLPGEDPIFNYMNYVSNEKCLENGVGYFTCGQKQRMYHQWILYRQQLDDTGNRVHHECTNPKEFAIEIYIKFDRDWYYFENDFYLLDRKTGVVLINSTRDQDSIGVLLYQDTLSIDLCVPNGSYNFTFDDSAGDGFTAGSGSFFKVFVNGYEVGAVNGDFGNNSTIMIDHHSSATTNNNDNENIKNDKNDSSSGESGSSGAGTSIASSIIIPWKRNNVVFGWTLLLIMGHVASFLL